MPGEVAQLVRIDGAEHRSDRLPVVGDRRSGEVAAPLGTEDAVAITGQAEQRIAGLGEEDDLADPAGLRQIDLAAIDAAAHHDPRSTRWRRFAGESPARLRALQPGMALGRVRQTPKRCALDGPRCRSRLVLSLER
jgi:hypothetical protein